MSVKIFAMTHKRFEVPKNPMYIPLHVGHKDAKEDFGYIGDDTGDNISDLNCYYAELSGVYWVWKNYRSDKKHYDKNYVGICHYRRFLTNEDGYVFSEAEYEKIFEEYDIITTKQLVLPGSYRNGFGAHHNVEILDETGGVIAELCPKYYDTFVSLVNQNKTYFGNIMVAEKKVYDSYCEWLFAIFFALQKRIDLTFADDYHKRVFGFISEFLLYVWVTVNGLRAYECKVAIIGEKKETNEVTIKMAEYFRQKDPEGARGYFTAILKKRPDILMEASDINGECKLCLQAVSTANLELEEYGRCFLDSVNEYGEVINYFRKLNSFAAEAVRAVATEKEQENFLQKTEYVKTIEEKSTFMHDRKDMAIVTMPENDKDISQENKEKYKNMTDVSEIAFRAAIRLYAVNPDMAERAYQYCLKRMEG